MQIIKKKSVYLINQNRIKRQLDTVSNIHINGTYMNTSTKVAKPFWFASTHLNLFFTSLSFRVKSSIGFILLVLACLVFGLHKNNNQ